MCGRYALAATSKALSEHYDVAVGFDLPESYNVTPRHLMPVITGAGAGWDLRLMGWGLTPGWMAEKKYKLINSRAETLFTKPMWRKLISTRRALIPATGFYEWKPGAAAKDPKQPHYITVEGSPIFSFAGVWESWTDASGQATGTYSIITTTPNAEMAPIHNRMPVIVHPDDYGLWLDHRAPVDFLHQLLTPYDAGRLQIYRVSTRVNKVENNDTDLITKIKVNL